jgi:hypothetical protein
MDTSDLQLFDEDLDTPFMKQQVMANAVRRRSPVSTPSSAVETPLPQPGANPNAPMQSGDYRDQAFALLKQASESTPDQADVNALREHALARDEDAKRQLLAGMALSMKGGQSLAPLGESMLRSALAAGAPEKFGGGLVAGGQFIADPEVTAQRRAQRLETQAKIYESMAQHADSVEQRRAAAQAAADLRRDLAQNRSPRLQRAGMTPTGQAVSFDPSTGDTLVGGQSYSGPVMSQAEIDKRTGTIMEAQAGAQRANNLLEKVKAYPRAFGGIPGLAQYTGPYASARIVLNNLSPEERQVRMQVLQDAAMVIHDLYGSALTAGEERRADTFAVKPTDPPEIIMDKLQTASAWANNHANTYGALLRGAADARRGAPGQASAPGAPPATRPAGGATSWKDLP